MASFELLMLGFIGQTEMIIFAIVLMVLFGGAKLPSLMRNMGRSVNEFKAGIREKPSEPPRMEEDTEVHKEENVPVEK